MNFQRKHSIQYGLASGQVIVALLLAACAPGQGTSAPQGNTVDVTEAEFKIDMPTSLPAGPTTFNITNNGTVEHNFEVEGEGLEEELEENLQPGTSGALQVDLQPGTYEIYCPIEGHKDAGMLVELTVTEGG